MESHRLNSLTEKFWQGACNEEEERELFEALEKGQMGKDGHAFADYGTFLKAKRTKQVLDEDFDKELLQQLKSKPVKSLRTPTWMKMAAILLFLVSISLGIPQLFKQSSVDIPPAHLEQQDMGIAFQEVQKALFILSSNLNEGMKQTQMLGEFHKAEQELKMNKSKKLNRTKEYESN